MANEPLNIQLSLYIHYYPSLKPWAIKLIRAHFWSQSNFPTVYSFGKSEIEIKSTWARLIFMIPGRLSQNSDKICLFNIIYNSSICREKNPYILSFKGYFLYF